MTIKNGLVLIVLFIIFVLLILISTTKAAFDPATTHPATLSVYG